MKKTIKHPDGRIEEIEGTPEELAILENGKSKEQTQNKDESKKSSRRVLLDKIDNLEKQVDLLQKENEFLKQIVQSYKQIPMKPPQYPYPDDWWVGEKPHTFIWQIDPNGTLV